MLLFTLNIDFKKNFENMSNEGVLNVPKIYVKCFIPLTKVNILNDDYDHNILHQFLCSYTIQ